jgi:hypothetical protein
LFNADTNTGVTMIDFVQLQNIVKEQLEQDRAIKMV